MTREQIIERWSTLTARERDAWVAEVMFGHMIGRERRINGEIFVVNTHAQHGFQRAVPRYTTDIAAAWPVAESFGTWQITKIGVGRGDRYRAIVKANKFVAYALTAPEAICLAALIAKLTEVSE